MGVSASGCHHNMSLWRGGEDVFDIPMGNDLKNLPGMQENYMHVRGGENTFMPDGDDPQMPQKAGLEAIGGIVHHLRALTAIGCSTLILTEDYGIPDFEHLFLQIGVSK